MILEVCQTSANFDNDNELIRVCILFNLRRNMLKSGSYLQKKIVFLASMKSL